jgi:hypothetical protein
MTVTVSDFERITGVKRMTVYSWIYRNKMPRGIAVAGIGKSKILKVSKTSDYFELLETELA